ncbi:hypothetical protein COCVIDRAFT_87622 [Bipolaris victoriae FI3]|uniref:Uncharacterized protein n=1 Tax=Bipolaris victoriae (strain FI3) TaxID=930091 RepID=W7F630_BIPV3|nr:hypothetical protein COCVIDRAFT_87622 [Bipolaris victoriae FI3]
MEHITLSSILLQQAHLWVVHGGAARRFLPRTCCTGCLVFMCLHASGTEHSRTTCER